MKTTKNSWILKLEISKIKKRKIITISAKNLIKQKKKKKKKKENIAGDLW